MAGKAKKYLLISALVPLVLLCAIGFGLIPVNLSFAKSFLNEFVAEQLGMDLQIQGPLRIRLGPAPALTASKIALKYPPADGPALAQIEQLAISLRLMALLDGDIFLRKINISDIEIDYCLRGSPKATVDTKASNELGTLSSIAIDELKIRNIRASCSEQENRLGLLPQDLDLEAFAPLNGPMQVSVTGHSEELETHLQFSTGSLVDLLNDPSDFPFELNLQIPDSDLSISGQLTTPFSSPEISVEGVLVSDRMEQATGSRRLSFNGTARDFFTHPYFEIEATLQQVDFQRLSAAASDPDENEESMDFRPIYEILQQFNARAGIRIGRILGSPVPLDALNLEARLEDGVLDLSKAELLFDGNPLAARAKLDMRDECVRLTSEVHISNIGFASLNHFLDGDTKLGGFLDQTDMASSSCGDTVRQHSQSMQLTASASGVTTSWEGRKLPLSFQSLAAEINWNEPGRLQFKGQLLEEDLDLSAGFGSIKSIQSGQVWPLSITVRGDTPELTLAGKAGLGEDGLDLDVNLAFKVPRFGDLHAWVGANPQNNLAFQGRTSLRLGVDGLYIEDLNATLGSSDAAGTISWAGPDSASPATFTLRSNRLDLIEFTDLFAADAEAQQAEKWQWAERMTQSTWLEDWLALPPLDIDLSVNHLDGIRLAGREARLKISLRDRIIDNGRLSYRVGDLTIDGLVDANLRESPWTLDFETVFNNINIGRLLSVYELADNVDAQAQRASILYSSTGRTLKHLAENSRMEAKIETLNWAFVAGAEDQRHEIKLSSLELNTAPETNSTWLASGYVNDIPLRAWMVSPSLRTTFDPTVPLPLRLTLGTGQDITMIDARIDRHDPVNQRMALSISGQFDSDEPVDLSLLEPPLEDYHFSSDVVIGENELLFNGLNARIGTSQALGDIGIRYREPDYLFDIDINSPFLETDDLVHWVAEWRKENRAPSPESQSAPAGEAAEGGILALVDKSIDDFTGSNEFDISISIDELQSSGQSLGQALLELKTEGEDIHLNPLQVISPAGKAIAHYHGVDKGAEYEYALDVLVEGLQYGGLLRLFDPDAQASGELFLETSLVSRSPDASSALGHINGTFDLAVFPRDARAEFLDLWASNLIFALLPATGGSDKVMNCMVSRFEVEKGVMHSANTFLDSTEVIVRARGDIDLGKQQLDLLIAPQAKREKFLSVSTPIAVTGPFADFQVGVAPGGFLTSMFRLYYGLIYVPWKWLTGERFAADGIATCHKAMGWEMPDNPK